MTKSDLEAKFEIQWRLLHPDLDLETEHLFHEPAPGEKPRRWRFDFAHLASKVAIEIDGGTFTQGRHSRGTGRIKDFEKECAAKRQGWEIYSVPGVLVDKERVKTGKTTELHLTCVMDDIAKKIRDRLG